MFNRGLGTYAQPNIVETILDGEAEVGQPVVLLPVNQGDPAQDTIPHLRRLSEYYDDGLVSARVNRRWGEFDATQIEFAPLGVPSGLCVGVASAPRQGQGLTLQPCGVSARTVWIIDPTGSPEAGFFAIVSSATRNLSRPYAMDYAGAVAAGEPPEPIRVRHLKFTGKNHLLSNRQLWGAIPGAIE